MAFSSVTWSIGPEVNVLVGRTSLQSKIGVVDGRMNGDRSSGADEFVTGGVNPIDGFDWAELPFVQENGVVDWGSGTLNRALRNEFEVVLGWVSTAALNQRSRYRIHVAVHA